MAARRQQGAGGVGAGEIADAVGEAVRDNPAIKNLTTLTGAENYELWKIRLGAYIYGKGDSWNDMWDAAEGDPPAGGWEIPNSSARRAAYNAIVGTLNDSELMKHKPGCASGAVEKLLSKIFNSEVRSLPHYLVCWTVPNVAKPQTRLWHQKVCG